MKKKRILGILLSLAMMLTMIPGMTAFASSPGGNGGIVIDTPVISTVTVTLAEDLTYTGTGEAQQLIKNVTWTKGEYDPDLYLRVNSGDWVRYVSDNETLSNSALMGTDAGTYTVYYYDGKIIPSTYTSTDDDNVHTVGTVTITAASVDITGVTLDPSTASVEAGKTVALTATVLPDNATDKTVTWTSSDETVATVSNGSVTGVKAGTATITATATNGTDDTSDDKTATCAVTVTAAAHTHNDITFTAWEKTDSLPTTAGNYYLANDVTITSGQWYVPAGGVNLCLNGHKINNTSSYTAIELKPNAVLTLYDESDSTGSITSQNNIGVTVKSGCTFTMKGGAITGCKSQGVCLYGGTFNLEDGSITNNKSCGVALNNYGSYSVFNMKGGSISGNINTDSNYKVGGVAVASKCTFSMEGGEITGNKSSYPYGGIYLKNKDSVFNISGKSIINNNLGGCTIDSNYNYEENSGIASNVYLTGCKINVDGEMGNTTPIGVAMSSTGVGVFTNSTGGVTASSYVDNFISDKSASFSVRTEGDELELFRKDAVSYLAADGTMKQTDMYAPIEEFDPNSSSLESGWYFVNKNYSFNNQVLANGTVNLILGDDATLEMKNTFRIDKSNSSGYNSVLNIYAQSTGDNTGKLIATGSGSSSYSYPGIGATNSTASGRVNIYGGNIKVNGAVNAAAIGGGYNSYGGMNGIVLGIYGGTLEAVAGEGAVAIGAGAGSDDHGVVLLGKNISVLAGDDESSATNVTATFTDKHDQKWVKTTTRKSVKATVTFKVANGSWDDGEGEAATADKTVELTGYESDVLKLTADQIPEAGSKPSEGYKEGSWDTIPSAKTVITGNTTYTYTYAQRDAADLAKDLINAIPSSPTTEDGRAAVKAAREAYDKLTDDQKDRIKASDLKKLTDAEDAIEQADAAAELAQKKTEAVQELENYRKTKTDADYDDSGLDELKKAVESGTASIKGAATVTDVKTELANAKAEIDAVKTIDDKQAEKVNELIDAIPDDITTKEGRAAVSAAREAYNKLTEAQKALVGSAELKKLKTAEAAVSAVESAEAARKTAEEKAAAAEKAQKEAEEKQAAAEKAQKEAEASQKAAEAAAAQAKADKEAAEKAAAQAETDKKAAQEAQAKAEASQKVAEEARAKAEADKKIAEEKQAEAEAAKKVAEEKQAEAEAAKKVAEEKQAEAEAAKNAAEQKAASNIDKATVTGADIKRASDLGATTVTLGTKVKKINKKAFAGTNIKTVVVKSKKLTKKRVKNSLKGSKVTKVRVKVSKKKSVNNKYVKKYKKLFTKKNCGRKVTVKK